MKRLFALLGISMLVALGCANEGVGDPCAPQRPGGVQCVPGGDGGGTGCFQGTEIYIETQSLQCRSRICLVYDFSESADPTPSNRAQHVYCTCRCGVPSSLTSVTDPATLCNCPDTFTCVQNLAGPQYNTGVQGSYCVRTNTVDGG